MRFFGTILVVALVVPVLVCAQDAKTLADIRQELEITYARIMILKRELSTTGAVTQSGANAPALQRIDAIEEEVRHLTGLLEEKQFWIENIVKDGTNRVGDLEFRLCELEAGCDIADLSRADPLGGRTSQRQATVPAPGGGSTGTDATQTEMTKFQGALATFEAGDFAGAASQFETLIETFPGGPLTGEAHYWKGASFAGMGEWNSAARSFLESFSGSREGAKAPDALYRLGVSLRELGQVNEACLMLAEVETRYPQAVILDQAQAEHRALGCS